MKDCKFFYRCNSWDHVAGLPLSPIDLLLCGSLGVSITEQHLHSMTCKNVQQSTKKIICISSLIFWGRDGDGGHGLLSWASWHSKGCRRECNPCVWIFSGMSPVTSHGDMNTTWRRQTTDFRILTLHVPTALLLSAKNLFSVWHLVILFGRKKSLAHCGRFLQPIQDNVVSVGAIR